MEVIKEEVVGSFLKEPLFIPIFSEDDESVPLEGGVKSFIPGIVEEWILPEAPGSRCRTKQSMEMNWTSKTQKRASDSLFELKIYSSTPNIEPQHLNHQ
jgi:hypothetical protein